LDKKVFEIKEALQRVRLSEFYEATFSSLWYGSLPCSGVQGISGGMAFASQVLFKQEMDYQSANILGRYLFLYYRH
jgi:hypothetical protein